MYSNKFVVASAIWKLVEELACMNAPTVQRVDAIPEYNGEIVASTIEDGRVGRIADYFLDGAPEYVYVRISLDTRLVWDSYAR